MCILYTEPTASTIGFLDCLLVNSVANLLSSVVIPGKKMGDNGCLTMIWLPWREDSLLEVFYMLI